LNKGMDDVSGCTWGKECRAWRFLFQDLSLC
jgi:hypothetical protein